MQSGRFGFRLLDIRMAKDTGRLELKGNPILIRTISSWLRPGTFAHIRPQSGAISIKQSGKLIRKPGMHETKKTFLEKSAELYAKL